MSLSESPVRLRPAPWRRLVKQPLSLPGRLWRGLSRRAAQGLLPQRLDDADVKALYLLLLARLPEAERIYDDSRGRPSADLISDLLRSSEFRDRILAPLLAQNGLPHDRLGHADLVFARAWLERAGIGHAGAAADWSEVLAAFLNAPPASRLLPRLLPAEAPRLAQTAAEIRRLRQPGQPPADDADVKALYLLLLGRMPESAAAYRAGRGRSRDDILADLLATAEFRDNVAIPQLLDLPIPQLRLDSTELGFVRAWMAGIGMPPPTIDPEWADLFAGFMLAPTTARLAARILPAYAGRLQQAARLLQAKASGRLPLGDRDIEALYLLILARRPEGEVIYRDRRGRRRDQMIADMFGSGEFRERVLEPFLSTGILPQERLGSAELTLVGGWFETLGLPLPEGARDWLRLLSAVVATEPTRRLVRQALPEEAEKFLQRLGELARAGTAKQLRLELDAVATRLRELEAQWKEHSPAFHNAAMSIRAVANEQARLVRELQARPGEIGTD